MYGNINGGFFYRIFIDAAPEPALLDVFAGHIQFAVSGSHGNSEGTISGSSGSFNSSANGVCVFALYEYIF